MDILIFLKSVSIFASIPSQALAKLAAVVEETQFTAGDVIIHKGDLGDSLYIVAEGEVRVHDGERSLGALGADGNFGEMFSLDPQVRSATVTSIRDTRVNRLGRTPLFQVMADHVEVGQGIIQALAQRLRVSLREVHKDFAYIQQFERVTNAARSIETGIYQPESMDEVAKRADALGQLARVFQRMAHEAYAREERLKRQVAELHIEIDKAKSAKLPS